MHWNYRVVRKVVDGVETFGIHEAFYESRKDTHPSITVDPVEPYGDSLEELKDSLKRMKKALKKPTIEFSGV